MVSMQVTKRDIQRQAWADFLRKHHWNLFATLTFQKSTTAGAAHNRFRRFADGLTNSAGIKPGWFVVAEPNAEQRRSVHLHALLQTDVPPGMVERLWWRQFGIAKVRRFDPDRGALYYCAKTLADSESEFFFSDDLMER
jgi:hypothetical protein